MLKVLSYISRVLVGSLFIVSGLIKANDPIGFSYKLEEYFAESALNLPSLEGFALLFGAKMRLAVWSLLTLLLFFGWLTFYTATCNPQDTYTIVENGQEITRTVTCVTDCGCFGDALKGSLGRSLTPWESFSKDMILLVLMIPVLLFHRKISLNSSKEDVVVFLSSLLTTAFFSWVFAWYFPLLFLVSGFVVYLLIKGVSKNYPEWITALCITLISAGFVWYCFNHLPVRDYRPFAIGKNIKEQMIIPEGAEKDVYENTFTYKNAVSGETKSMSQEEYMKSKIWEDSTWVWQDTKNKLIKQGYKPPIHDFTIIAPDGSDYTEDILNEPVIFLLISYDIKKANEGIQPIINQLANEVFNAGYYFYGISASSQKDVDEFKVRNKNNFDYCMADETTLKTIVRSNPGLLLLKNGTVSGMWHYNDIPDFNYIKTNLIDK
jgi:hypothetical protein